jgi:hypothetical protein
MSELGGQRTDENEHNAASPLPDMPRCVQPVFPGDADALEILPKNHP